MTNESMEEHSGRRAEGSFARYCRRAAVLAAMVLCVDLAFVACSQKTQSLELTQVEESDADTAEEDASEDSSAEEDSSESQEMETDDAAEESAPDETGDAAEDSAQEDMNVICVYVCGAVAEPGVYVLPEGTRVYEAVAAAGGFTAEADETYVNQALILSDQDQLYIPTKEETSGEDAQGVSYGLTSGADSSLSSGSSSGSSGSSLVNLNTADQEELESLPGIGEAKAAAIIAYREENGAFSSIEEIQNVSGIGEVLFENLKDLITV